MRLGTAMLLGILAVGCDDRGGPTHPGDPAPPPTPPPPSSGEGVWKVGGVTGERLRVAPDQFSREGVVTAS